MPHASPSRNESIVFAIGVAAIVALAAALRAPGLAPPSLYLDDVWVALLAREASLADILTLKPHHPLGFLAFESLGRRFLPGNELSVQLIPFLASLALIPLGGWLVRRTTAGVSGGLLAAVLLALNPALAEYSVRAKPYATDALLSLALAAATVTCLFEPTPRRVWRLGLLAPVSILLSYPAALVGAVGFVVALGSALASIRPRAPFLTSAAAFVALETALGLLLVHGQSNQTLQRFWEYGFVPRESLSAALAFGGSRTVLVIVSSFPRDWWALGVLPPLGLALLLGSRKTRRVAALIAALWTSLFAAAALRLYPLDDRTVSFAYPLVAVLAAVTLWSGTRRSGRPLLREGVPAFVAAALVLTSTAKVAYPPSDDARLVRSLAQEARPDDTVLLYPHTNWAAGYYSGWQVRLVPSDSFGTRFESRLLRERTVQLPSPSGYENQPHLLDPALQELVSQSPERVIYLATHLDASRNAAHIHVARFLAASGYSAERLAVAPDGELLRFTRLFPRPLAGPSPLPKGPGSPPSLGASTPAGP